jgi:hypothetical protein
MDLGKRIASRLQAATFDRIAGVGLENAAANRPRIDHSILELAEVPIGEGETAVVIGAGPSLHRRDSLTRLRKSGFAGTIVAVDGALGSCLRADVVPHVVVSVDPHRERIVRWFGDPALTAAPSDDYFRRQEMDPAVAADEVAANRALIALVNAHGARMRAAVATSAAPAVVARCQAAGIAMYWWNPMYDDYEQADSVSRRLFEANGLPCLNGGGNVGTAAWVIAHAVLAKRRVALLGIDFSYPPGTPYTRTQYYPELREMLGDAYEQAYVKTDNPFGETWMCDPAYWWFRGVFLEMAREANCRTVNCTEGGILFGDPIEVASIEEFVNG